MTRPTPEERAEIDAVVRESRRDGRMRGFHVHVAWDDDQPFAVPMPPIAHRRNEAVRVCCKDCDARLTAVERDEGFTTCGPCARDRRAVDGAAVNRKTPASRRRCAYCDKLLRLAPKYVRDRGRALTADGAPPTYGHEGNNLWCSLRCGFLTALALINADPAIRTILPPGWNERGRRSV